MDNLSSMQMGGGPNVKWDIKSEKWNGKHIKKTKD